MTSYRPWRIAAVVLACAWLLAPSDARGGENLLPPDPDAAPVRVLLILPSDSGKLGRQVALLDRALAKSRGFLLRATSLDEADIVVYFTRYQRTTDEKGVNTDWWYGQFRLLEPSPRDVRLSNEASSKFTLLVIDQQSWEMRVVVDLLSRTLARALGRQARPREAEAI